MNISSIGVQQILPQTGTKWQSAAPVQPASNNSGSGEKSARPGIGPASKETGQIVDKPV
jgi:hypothetical protein